MTAKMRHVGCGGEIKEGKLKYQSDLAWERNTDPDIAELICQKCGKEIVGDPQIEIEEEA